MQYNMNSSAIYYWTTILRTQKLWLSLGKNSYKTIHNVNACIIFKTVQLLKIGHIIEVFIQMMQMMDSFQLAFGSGSATLSLSLNEDVKFFHLTRFFKSIYFCLNFTYLILYFDSNLTFICRQPIILFYCSQEAQSINGS